MRFAGFRSSPVPRHLGIHAPDPPRGSQRALRSIRKGLADSDVDDSRVARFRASPNLGRTGNFFGASRRPASIWRGPRRPGGGAGCWSGARRVETDARTFLTGWCLCRRCGGVVPTWTIGAGAVCRATIERRGNSSPSETRQEKSGAQVTTLACFPNIGEARQPVIGNSRMWRCEFMRAVCPIHRTARLQPAAAPTGPDRYAAGHFGDERGASRETRRVGPAERPPAKPWRAAN